MIYFRCTVAGFLAELAAAILTVIAVIVGLFIASRSTGTRPTGWDPISLARPFTWLAVVFGIFLSGFFSEFFRVRSK